MSILQQTLHECIAPLTAVAGDMSDNWETKVYNFCH